MLDQTQLLEPTNTKDYERLELLGKARPVLPSWHCPALQRMVYDKRRKLLLQDISGIGAKQSYQLFSVAAVEALTQVCNIEAQWLPANFSERDYSILNLPYAIDASDREKTSAHELLDGRIGYVLSYTFIESALTDQWIFKDNLHPYDTLCTDRFVDSVQSKGFTGFHFDAVWDSELPQFSVNASPSEIRSRPEVYGPRGFRSGRSEKWPPEWHEEAKAMKKRGELVNY